MLQNDKVVRRRQEKKRKQEEKEEKKLAKEEVKIAPIKVAKYVEITEIYPVDHKKSNKE